MIPYYIALMREMRDCHGAVSYVEPHPVTGYMRVQVPTVDDAIACVSGSYPIEFDNLNGYGWITHCAIMENATGGTPVSIVPLERPVYVEEGVVPILHKGRLLLGVDISASIASMSQMQILV